MPIIHNIYSEHAESAYFYRLAWLIHFSRKDVQAAEDMAKVEDALRNDFSLFKDEVSLRSAIESVCAEFGKVITLSIALAPKVRQEQDRRCCCILRLDTDAAEDALMRTLKVFHIDIGLAFLANMDKQWGGS